MGVKRNRQFWESAKYNNRAFSQYYNRLTELSISMFEWKNLPDSIDPRFMELILFGEGYCVFFYDEVLGFLALRTTIGGNLNVYNIPTKRMAYASNGYQRYLDIDNSVIIWNNLLHTNSILDVEQFSYRLAKLDRTIDVNVTAQKTPVLISCDEEERLTMQNLMMKYEGDVPFIFGSKAIRPDSVKVLNTEAPYVSDKLYQLKMQYWNEALTYLGIANVNVQKKERLITDEVMRNAGGTIASRYSRLEARRQACNEINRMFNLDKPIWVDYREDFQRIDVDNDTIESEPDSEGQGGTVEGEDGDVNE